MKIWNFYYKKIYFRILPLVFLISFINNNLFSQPGSAIARSFLEAEVIFQKELSLRRVKGEILKNNKIAEEDIDGFKKFALEEYSRDKEKFFNDYTSGKLKKVHLPSYFSFLRAKYISLYKVFLTKKGNDDFTLFYKKGIGGGDEVMGPGQPCNNMDLEQCNFTGWDLYTGDVPGSSQFSYTNVVPATPGTFHTISNAGFDATAQGSNPSANISKIYLNGGTCSAMLGDFTGTGAKGASMKQTFMVDSNNAVFTYSYAAFLQDPSHPPSQQPYFRVRVYDSGNNSIPCGEYNVIGGPASSGGDPTFISATYNGETLYYKDWTTVFAPLNAYIGQNVTIEFVAGDCSQGGHFGYAYVEASCVPLEIISSSPVICGGQTVTLTAPPGAATYAWSGPTGNASTQTITTSTPGLYTVQVTPVSGSACAITMSITLPANPSIPVSDFTASSPCVGSPTAFNDQSSVSSPGTITQYHWDFGENGTADTSNLQDPTYIYNTAGTYNVNLSVTTDAGCVKDTTLSVNVIAGFDATFTPDTFCNDEPPANLSAVMPGGTWSGTGITNTTNGTFNPATSGIGTFPVTYMGGTGLCRDTFLANIIVDGVAITGVVPTNLTCYGSNDGMLSITATGAAQYSINDGSGPIVQTNGNFSGLDTGTYTIIVTSAINNCQKTSTATINQPPLLTLAFQAFNDTCYNTCGGYAVVVPSGGNSGYTYTWNTGAGNIPNSNGLCDGAYALTVTDSKNCSEDTTFVITEPVDYSIVLATVNSNCGHPDGSAEVISISGQTAPYNYLWSNSDPDSSATGIVNGNYSITITDANGCDTVMTAVVGYNPPPAASAIMDSTTCFASCDGSATVTGSGGNPPGIYTYLWNNSQASLTATALCAGSYTVTVYDSELCEGYASIVVEQPALVDVTPFPDDTICIDSAGTIGASAMGGTPPYTYSWDNGMTDSVNSVNPASQLCYTVSATDANGCVSNPEVQCISIFPPLYLMASGTVTICEGNSTDISAFAFGGNQNNYPLIYSWSNGSAESFQTVSPLGNSTAPVVFYVTATDGCAPPVTDSVIVSFYPQPVAKFFADTLTGCEPEPEFTVIFSNNSTVNNPVSCLWSIADGSQIISDCDTFSHGFPNVGSYDVSLMIVSGDGCQDDSTLYNYITVNPNPTADFIFSPQPTDVQNMNIKFTDLSTGMTVNQWQWSFYDNDASSLLGNSYVPNPEFNFSSEPDNPFIYYLTDTGSYPVTLWIKTDKNCMDSIAKEVKVDGVFYLNVPNAFTPNNDGINDYFFPSGVGIQPGEDFRFLIFDRWGDIIFESKSLDDPWDGTARSLGGKTLVKQDVYVWRLEVKDATREEEKHKYTGHVTLLK